MALVRSEHELRLDVISNGLGSQSLALLIMAARGELACRVSITADTGSEEDRLWSDGSRSTARQYFDRIIKPYADKNGIDARMVVAEDREKRPLKPLHEHVREMSSTGRFNALAIPLYGSKGGRRPQTCTDKWKIRAIRQEARRMGATLLVCAQGIHYGEADRRVTGRYIGQEGAWSVYQGTIRRKGVETVVKWCRHFYPLVDLRLRREDARRMAEQEGLPYLLSSECDMCPHQDLARWERHTPESLTRTAELEATLKGKFFFTDERIPLLDALELKRKKQAATPARQMDIDFGCGNGECGI